MKRNILEILEHLKNYSLYKNTFGRGTDGEGGDGEGWTVVWSFFLCRQSCLRTPRVSMTADFPTGGTLGVKVLAKPMNTYE